MEDAHGCPLHVWVLGAFDPVLIAIALAFLGWKADAVSPRSFIAAIAALLDLGARLLGLSMRSALPGSHPLCGEQPMLLQVRTAAPLIWASLGLFCGTGCVIAPNP